MAYIGEQPVVGNFVKLDAIVTSATATYNLLNGGTAYFPQTANNCIVSLNGVIQSPTSAYTISGSTIVFDSALTSLDTIDFILVLGDVLAIGTPSDGTVSFAKVTSNLITGATAETSIAGGDSVLIYDDSASALRKMTRTNFVAGLSATNTPAFEARLSANQTVNHFTNTKIQVNTEVYDSDNCYDNATNYRFTPTTAGKYFFYFSLHGFTGGSDPDGTRFVLINATKNGSTVAQFLSFDSDANEMRTNHVFATTVIELNGTSDYVEFFGMVYAEDTNNAGVVILGGSEYTKWGAFRLIG